MKINLLKILEKVDDIAEELTCMDGLTSEGRKSMRMGEELHKLAEQAITKIKKEATQ